MKYSVEKIYHFQCDCGKWFSIADLEEMGVDRYTEITCPLCENSQSIGDMMINKEVEKLYREAIRLLFK